MALLTLHDASLAVGSTPLVEGATISLVQGQRVALVGPNGSGKSTLLRALHALAASQRGEDSPRQYFVLGAGKIAGTLADSDDGANATLFIDQDEPPWSRLLPAANELCGGERELRRLTLVDALETEASFGDYAGLEMAEAWRLQHVSACAPGALGWGACAYDATPLNALSPGAARKAYLALALAKPDVACLLLDEPTNHLDLPSRLWLREALIASGKVR